MDRAQLLQHFDTLAETPDAVVKLRKLVRHLAVRGELLPADKSKSDVQAVLADIKRRKARNQNRGAVAADKYQDAVELDEQPHRIPASWFWTRIGTVTLSSLGGGTPSKNNSQYWDGDIPWASVKDVGHSKYLTATQDRITREGLDNSSSNLILKGRVIVCTRMGLGKISITKIDVAINQDLRALEFPNEVDIDFFYTFYLTQTIEGSGMTVAATNSAKAVLKSAEQLDQISNAAGFLGVEAPTLEKIASLSTNDTGFEVVLIPIAPCNPWLLGEVASTYERITDVPVKIRRLDQEWTWGTPDRVARQRDIESILIRLAKKNIVFTGWDRDRYLSALTEAVKSEDAFSKYWANDLISKAKVEPGQYRVEHYLDTLCERLKSHRSKDARTMYVGITEANIYGGDNNYVFSLGTTAADSHASLMSY